MSSGEGTNILQLTGKELPVYPSMRTKHALDLWYADMLVVLSRYGIVHIVMKLGDLDSMEEKEAPLNPKLMDTVRSRIVKNKQSIYQKAKEAATTHGVEWITPLDRPAQYHGRVNP